MAFTLLLAAMKRRFLWWPLHPIAYPLGLSWTMNWLWFPLFISWAAKWLILKYGGLKAHRQARPFFIGLILGEYVVGSILSIVSLIFDVPTYVFLH